MCCSTRRLLLQDAQTATFFFLPLLLLPLSVFCYFAPLETFPHPHRNTIIWNPFPSLETSKTPAAAADTYRIVHTHHPQGTPGHKRRARIPEHRDPQSTPPICCNDPSGNGSRKVIQGVFEGIGGGYSTCKHIVSIHTQTPNPQLPAQERDRQIEAEDLLVELQKILATTSLSEEIQKSLAWFPVAFLEPWELRAERWVCFNAYGVVVMMGGWCVPGHQSFQETMMEPAYKWDYHMALQPISFCSWFGGLTAAWLVHWVFSASLSTRYSLYKMLPWCTNLIPMSCYAGHFIIFFFFTSRKKDCFRVSVCILTSSNFVFCCNPPSLLGFVIVNIHLW